MKMFSLSQCCALLVLLCSSSRAVGSQKTAAPSASGSRPNIVVLFADDLGSGDLGVYGHPTTTTPNLDQLAAEGMRFTQWYSGFHVCSPSRGTMLTGRIPIRWGGTGGHWTGGVFNADAIGGLPTNETTIAELLVANGYATAAVGKWHVGQQHKFLPTSRGFEHYLGIPYSCDMGSSAWRPQDSKDRPPLPLLNGFDIVEQPTDLNKLSQRYVDFALEFVDNTTKQTPEKPFFLYYAFNHVHVPDFASPKFCNTSIRGRFGDALAELDDAVGQVMAGLKAAGVDDNTIVFFTSDNGPWLIMQLAGGSAGLLRDGKTTTWEGGIREPGIVRWPGKIAPNTLSNAVVTTYDIFATSLTLAQVPLPSDRIIDGKDISPVLFATNNTSPHDCLFHYKGTPNLGCKDKQNCPGLWAVRCGAYKAHWVTSTFTDSTPQFHDPALLFQLDNDPSETWPVNSKSDEYAAAMDIINNAVKEHQATLVHVQDQMALGIDPNLKVCCDPDSKSKYPQFPNCTCNPENFDAFVCSPLGPQITLGVEGFDLHNSSTWIMEPSYPVQFA